MPPLADVTCSGCQQNAGAVLDVITGNVTRVCTSCNHVVPDPDTVAERRDWSPSGPLSRLGPLCGWGASSPSPPGEGTQSWLFCPLMSLALLSLEARHAVPAHSTGPRAQVPDPQAQFWTAHAGDVIHAFADHFSGLTSDNPVSVALSSPASWGTAGDHLEARIQEALTPPHITAMLEVWPTSHVGSFGSDAEHTPQPLPLPAAPVPLPNGPSDPVPSPFLASLREVHSLHSLHNTLRHPSVVLLSPTLLSRQQHQLKFVVTFETALRPSQGLALFVSHDSWRCRLTSIAPQLIQSLQQDVSTTLGNRMSVLEGTTAWGVWLRIDHWRASRGGSRLWCEVLFGPVNRELTFHGVASVVTQLLLPLFED